jgi:5-formyltetrahydrofolate cyclo-ligase
MIIDMLKEGKKVYVPKVTDKRIEFYRIYGFDFLTESRFGILEPDITRDLSSYQITEKSLMILPGLAFDPLGNRIGYGAGYYDRYLNEKKSDHFIKIAIAYDFQIVEKIEVMDHDVRADIILTPTRVYQCNHTTN